MLAHPKSLAGVSLAEHTLTLNTVTNPGLLYDTQGKLAEAQQIYLQTLAGFRASLESEHTPL
jgi:hypothetical protein